MGHGIEASIYEKGGLYVFVTFFSPLLTYADPPTPVHSIKNIDGGSNKIDKGEE